MKIAINWRLSRVWVATQQERAIRKDDIVADECVFFLVSGRRMRNTARWARAFARASVCLCLYIHINMIYICICHRTTSLRTYVKTRTHCASQKHHTLTLCAATEKNPITQTRTESEERWAPSGPPLPRLLHYCAQLSVMLTTQQMANGRALLEHLHNPLRVYGNTIHITYI